MTSFGVAAMRPTSRRISPASIGLISMPSFAASASTALSRHIAMNASCSAFTRSAGTPGGATNGSDMKNGISAKSISDEHRGVLGQLAAGRHVGKVRMAAGAAEQHRHLERAVLPHRALAGFHRADADELAVDLLALHGKEHRRRAGVAAHDADVQVQRLLGDDAEDQVRRCGVVGAERDLAGRAGADVVDRFDRRCRG